MKAQSIKNILEQKVISPSAKVNGWVRSIRKSKAFSFVVLNDGSCFDNLQIIVPDSLSNYEEMTKCLIGSSFGFTGELVASQGKGQSVEMQAKELVIYGKTDESYPLQKKGTSLEFLREIAHLRPRTNTMAAVFRLRHALAQATHEFFDKNGFYYINTPIVTASDCEGAGEMFRVSTLDLNDVPKLKNGEVDYSKDYFGKESYLAVSGQLEAECFASGLGKVYTFGPTFRSENSHTARHLSEFWMVEPEVAFADLDDVADLGSDYIKFMIEKAMERCPSELAFFEKFYEKGLQEKLKNVLSGGLTKVSYTDAIDILQKSNQKFEFPVKWGVDLQTEHERYLCEKHFNGPVAVMDYPRDIKAFYMRQNDDGKTVRAMDILVPGVGELIGGSQREERYDVLSSRMDEMGLSKDEYWWYLDLRKHGTVPHSGFGLGFERALMYISGMSNIRDVIAFPRTSGSVEF